MRVESLRAIVSTSRLRSSRLGNPLVGLLRQRVELRNGVVERLLGEVASAVGRVQDLVAERDVSDCLHAAPPVSQDSLEHGEVEGKTQADGVGRGQLGDGNVRGGLVGLEGLVGRVLALVAGGELGEVTVVVTHPAQGRSGSVPAHARHAGSAHILW